jgi:hypothetical protein
MVFSKSTINWLMRTPAKIFLCFLGGFALSASTRAATVATAESSNHPYQNIPATNVFRLKSPAQPEPVPPPPPPQITLQGFTTIPGRAHVLFKVMMPAKPPEPAKEIAYVLSEGEREGEIRVLEINEQAGTAKFINHGVEQTLARQR